MTYALALGLTVFLGVGQLWDDESSLGTAVNLGGGVTYRVTDRLDVELVVDRRDHDRRFGSGVRFDAGMIRGTGRVLKYFSYGSVEPYVGGAYGAARIHRITEFPGIPRSERMATSASASAIAGARVTVDRRFFLRPEFEVGRAGDYLIMSGAVAAGWRW